MDEKLNFAQIQVMPDFGPDPYTFKDSVTFFINFIVILLTMIQNKRKKKAAI